MPIKPRKSARASHTMLISPRCVGISADFALNCNMRCGGSALSFLCLSLFCLQRILSGAAAPPNIVLLFADDLGYGDLDAFGHPTSSTPNLDILASEGLVFTQFYSASPVCSPSRAALLTGRYQTRSGIWPGVFNPGDIGGLPHNETTIAEILKQKNYKTAIIGKWHLGVGERGTFLPTHQGFDYYKGIPYSHDMCPLFVCFYPNGSCASKGDNEYTPCPVYENTDIVEQPADLTHLSQNYSSAATGFIEENAGKSPFFLYMAFQHTHKPQFSGEMFTNTSIRGIFGDALSELDWQVGQIMKTLNTTGVIDDTFVFFTSDNGPSLHMGPHGGNAGPLRCGKGTTWEGGQREPTIAWWPGKIRHGRTAQLAATVDLLPTLSAIAGADLPQVTLDGVDMSPILFDNMPSKRDYYIYYPKNPDPNVGIFAVRWKQYKAHYYAQGSHCLDTYPDIVCRNNYTRRQFDPPALYNIHEDPSEMYPLDNKEYASILDLIGKKKADFESSMTWGKSQIDSGSKPSLMPCAKPNCSPFPTCCTTDPNARSYDIVC